MIFNFPTPLLNILSHLMLYRIAERMRKDLVIAALPFHCLYKRDCSS